MTEKPLVTVLMTVYNGGEYLKTSVRSILDQSYKDFEFLIINDCSTDNSVETIRLFNDDRIVIHNNECNLGQTKSLNVGLKLARGKYVARMDADDLAYPLWLKKIIDYFEKHQDFAVVSAWAVVIDSSGKMKKFLETPISFQEVIFHIFFGNAINHVGAVLNKEIIIKNGGYNEEFKISQDYELWSSLIRNNHKLTSIPERLIAVRVHDSSLSFLEEKKKGLSEVVETIYKNIISLTDLEISREDVVKLRMFYRFPEQISLDEFKYSYKLYTEIFFHLKNQFKIETSFLKKKIKKQMAIPCYKRIIFEVKNNSMENSHEIILYYKQLHGFTKLFFVLYLISFLGETGKKIFKKNI